LTQGLITNVCGIKELHSSPHLSTTCSTSSSVVSSYNQPASVDSVVINDEEIEESVDENDQDVPKKRKIISCYHLLQFPPFPTVPHRP